MTVGDEWAQTMTKSKALAITTLDIKRRTHWDWTTNNAVVCCIKYFGWMNIRPWLYKGQVMYQFAASRLSFIQTACHSIQGLSAIVFYYMMMLIKTIITLMLPIFILLHKSVVAQPVICRIVSCHQIGNDISANEDPAVVGKTLFKFPFKKIPLMIS